VKKSGIANCNDSSVVTMKMQTLLALLEFSYDKVFTGKEMILIVGIFSFSDTAHDAQSSRCRS